MRHTVSLRENRDFRALYARGKSAAGVYLAVYMRKNRVGVLRLGVTVSAKLGGAVVRNRIRRLVKEAYRLHEPGFTPGHDLVVVARGRAVGAPYTAICGDLLRLAARLGVYTAVSEKGQGV